MNRIQDTISIELQGRGLKELNDEIESLMSGSLEVVGQGMMIGSDRRDLEIEADSIEEIKAFRFLLESRGFKLEPIGLHEGIDKVDFDISLNEMLEDLEIDGLEIDSIEARRFVSRMNREIEIEQVQDIINTIFDMYPEEHFLRECIGDIELVISIEEYDTGESTRQILNNKMYLTQQIMAFYVSNHGVKGDVIYKQLEQLKRMHIVSYIDMIN
mgnify:CR=1 FL=1